MKTFLFVLITLCQLCTISLAADADAGVEAGLPDHPPLTPYYTGSCILCPAGRPGPPGPPGVQGVAGRDGRDGRDGLGDCCCDKDDDGDDTDGGPPPNPGAIGGAVYVRWGRTECSSDSELVYTGLAAGGHYTHKGSGSNYLCMPDTPIYDEVSAGTGGNRALVYGAEFETNTIPFWSNLHDQNVACAVCWAPSRPSLLMVPGRNVCPGSQWTTEYSGYLVASYYNHEGRSEFVCMDREAEGIRGTSANANGALFYVAEGRCGSGGSGLRCGDGQYVDGNELTCAVCTR